MDSKLACARPASRVSIVTGVKFTKPHLILVDAFLIPDYRRKKPLTSLLLVSPHLVKDFNISEGLKQALVLSL
jgi:hypothetical protein